MLKETLEKAAKLNLSWLIVSSFCFSKVMNEL